MSKSRVSADLLRAGEVVLFTDLDVYYMLDPLQHLDIDPKVLLAAQVRVGLEVLWCVFVLVDMDGKRIPHSCFLPLASSRHR